MDHRGGNSTFTGKAIASGKATVYSAIAGAMNALSGPLHGRANQSCLEFVLRIGTSDEQEVESFVRGELAAGRPVFGFGHAVLSVEDPRATAQFELGEQICPDDENFKIIKTLRKVAPMVLSENKKIRNPHANVDIASGALLHHVGLKDPTYYTTFFGIGQESPELVHRLLTREQFFGLARSSNLSAKILCRKSKFTPH